MVYSLDLGKRFKKKFGPVVQKNISSVISNNKTYFAIPYDHFCNAFPGYISSIPLQKELIHQMARNGERSELKAFWVIFASTQALTSDEFAQDTATLFGDSTKMGRPMGTILYEFYKELFPLESQELVNDTLNMSQLEGGECYHIMLTSVLYHYHYNSNVTAGHSWPFFNMTVISAITFQLFDPKEGQPNQPQSAYVRWLGTNSNCFQSDGFATINSHQDYHPWKHRGLAQQLLAYLQCICASTSGNYGHPRVKLQPPTIYTKYGITQEGHRAAICFWQFNGFKEVRDDDANQVSIYEKEQLARLTIGQDDENLLQLIKGDQFVWNVNPINIPPNRSLGDILLDIIFPDIQIPLPKLLLTCLSRKKNGSYTQFTDECWPDKMMTCLCLSKSPDYAFDPHQAHSLGHNLDQILALQMFSSLPSLHGEGNDDLYSVIGQLCFHQTATDCPERMAMSSYIRLQFCTAYSRLQRCQSNKGMPWLSNVWSCVVKYQKPQDKLSHTELEELNPLFDDNFKMSMSDLYSYMNLVRNQSKFGGSLIDLFLLFQLHLDRVNAGVTVNKFNRCISHPTPNKYTLMEKEDKEEEDDEDETYAAAQLIELHKVSTKSPPTSLGTGHKITALPIPPTTSPASMTCQQNAAHTLQQLHAGEIGRATRRPGQVHPTRPKAGGGKHNNHNKTAGKLSLTAKANSFLKPSGLPNRKKDQEIYDGLNHAPPPADDAEEASVSDEDENGWDDEDDTDVKNDEAGHILLVYPIAGGDPVEIDAAADGLNELHGPINNDNSHKAPPVAAAMTGTTTSSTESSPSGVDGTTNPTAVAAAAPPAIKSARTHYVTIQLRDYMRLEPKEYLNDSIIDFWMQWITRKGDASMMHIFSTQFYTQLVCIGPQGVTNWTARKNINIFEKKLLFIPINKSLHWSMVVVVNPLHIVKMEHPENVKMTDPATFILFMDSLKAHQITVIAKNIRKWLNSEWKRLQMDPLQNDPFTPKSLVVHTPKSM
jgi:Ulp1 protease family, C-terminal catalytic domain